MAAHNELGKKGEDAACLYLTKLGYKIIKRNWQFNRHEIDIIAENDEFMVFVEVKTRTSTEWGHPKDFISNKQIRRIVLAADEFIKTNNIEKEARFDIISILDKKGNLEIEHIDDAFMPPLN